MTSCSAILVPLISLVSTKINNNNIRHTKISCCLPNNYKKRPERIFVYCCCSNKEKENEQHALVIDSDESQQKVQAEKEEQEVEVEVCKLGKNTRKIKASIQIRASLVTIWNLLTDYQHLSDFIPALQLSHVILQQPNFARLLQIGEQDLAFGLKFNAKGTVDCYERDLEILSCSNAIKRDIDFNMIEGDFHLFQGKWSILQLNSDNSSDNDSSLSKDFLTTLSYLVEVTPKPWLPVGLVEGRLCKEIRTNLKCIRAEAEKIAATQETFDAS